MFADDTFKVFALSSVILVAKMLFLGMGTGSIRMLRKRWRNAEDTKHAKGGTHEGVDDTIERWRRVHQNALENELPWLMIAFLYAASGPSKNAMIIYCATFVALRVIHSTVYIFGLQPWRTLAYTGGVITTIGMMVRIVRVAV